MGAACDAWRPPRTSRMLSARMVGAYTSLQTLWESDDLIWVRGLAPDGAARLWATSAKSSERLAHVFALRQRLQPEWAARPLRLDPEGLPTTSLLLEDPGGTLLSEYVGKLELRAFLQVALALTGALGQLHRAGLVHRDLKPSHVLVDLAQQRAWLLGLGLATPLGEPTSSRIEGSLAYMAPEQRSGAAVGPRTDLYALGITLYELLAGSPPFRATDARGYFHQHSATAPDLERLRRAGVPAGLSAVLGKLLEKDAERRYASSSALASDLRRCFAQWEATSTVAPFPLAEGTEHEPERLYGRDALLDTLAARAGETLLGSGAGLLCVAGPSGIGKTALVHALRRRLPAHRLAAGKFDQQAINSPYAPFAQAFRALVRGAIASGEVELAGVRDALATALAGSGDLLAGLVPELTSVLGPQPPQHDLTHLDAQKRFRSSVRALLSVFASSEQPLLLFLDDLHLADPATVQLLEHLLRAPRLPHLLIVVAYRDQELPPEHALQALLGPCALQVPPLSEQGLCELVAGRLHLTREHAQPIASSLLVRTRGNPFFAGQLLRTMIEQEQLAFRDGAWQLQPAPTTELGDSVIELLLQRMAVLPDETRLLVRTLSCLGQQTPHDVLEVACARALPREKLVLALEHGLLVERDDGYAFVHDRVQQAAYESVPEREALHFRIGMRLLEQLPDTRREQLLFEIVHQLERGLAHAKAEHHEAIAGLNLAAGKRAKSASAHASALAFFVRGDELAASLPWDRHHALRFELAVERAECEILTSDLRAAEQHLTALAARARGVAARARVTCLHAALYTTLGQPDRSVEVCLAYLREAGFDWHVQPGQERAERELARMWSKIGDRPIETLVDLPTMADPHWNAIMDVLGDLQAPAFFTDRTLFTLVIAGSINITLEHGNSHGGTLAYMTLGAALCTHLRDSRSGFRFGKLGYVLAAERGFDRYLARIEMFYGLSITQWGRPVREGRALVQRTPSMMEATDITFSVYIRHLLVSHLLFSGDPLSRVEGDIEMGLTLARETQFGLAVIILETQRALVRSLRGTTSALGCLDGVDFDEQVLEAKFAADPRLAIAEVWYWIRKLEARFHARDLEAALSAAERAQPLMWIAGIGTVEHAEFHFFAALARCGLARVASGERRLQLMAAVSSHLEQLAAWAEPCPENFAHREALVAAELARAEGDDARAMTLYEQALQGAHAQRFVHHEAVTAELAAEFYGARGLTTVADAYVRRAAEGYQRWGALGKLAQLRRTHPTLANVAPCAGTVTFDTSGEALALATVLQASRSLSSELVVDRLIAALLSLAIEHAGAERGVLLLMRQGKLRAVASAGSGVTEIAPHDLAPADASLALSALNLVLRLKTPVSVDDALADEVHGSDPHVRERGVRSLLLVPIVEQTRLLGVLYCENNLAPRAFAAGSSSVLELLAAQAAISLENARLYRELQQDNAQREELLREIHHRVKNNLQLISSLLSLQATRSGDAKVSELFADMRNRVRSLSLVHENVYRTGDFAQVAMLPHLQSIGAQLARAYHAASRKVQLSIECDALTLPLGLAIPCGLVVNELVSNALKHAFPAGISGRVQLRLRALGPARACIEVSDDGVGMASEPPPGTLGWQLVRDLTRQLGGELTLEVGQGVHVRVAFALP